jgi:hypothetical protein
VNTTSCRFGICMWSMRRLCSRAPRTTMKFGSSAALLVLLSRRMLLGSRIGSEDLLVRRLRSTARQSSSRMSAC